MDVVGRECHQHENWFDDDAAAISNLFAEKNRLHKAYVTRPTDAKSPPCATAAAGNAGRVGGSQDEGDTRSETGLRSRVDPRQPTFSAMQPDAYRDERPEIQSRGPTTTVHALLSADDCSLNATTEGDMQWSMNLFVPGCVHLGLTINTNKMVAIHQHPPNVEYSIPRIHVSSIKTKTVDNSSHLGKTLSRCIIVDDDTSRHFRSQPYLQSQSKLRTVASLRVESPRPSNENHTENVQGRRYHLHHLSRLHICCGGPTSIITTCSPEAPSNANLNTANISDMNCVHRTQTNNPMTGAST
ncbi:hypothetical protein SprV_0301183900 [Sparganum proliferum]